MGQFARHMAADAKQMQEDGQTGAQAYRYAALIPFPARTRFTIARLPAGSPASSSRSRPGAMGLVTKAIQESRT